MSKVRFIVRSDSVPTRFVGDFSVEDLFSQEISGLIYHCIGDVGQSWHSPVVEVEKVFSIVLEDRIVVTAIVKDGIKAHEPSDSQDNAYEAKFKRKAKPQ